MLTVTGQLGLSNTGKAALQRCCQSLLTDGIGSQARVRVLWLGHLNPGGDFRSPPLTGLRRQLALSGLCKIDSG